MADKYTTIPFYNQYPNRGFGEFRLNPEDLVIAGNFTNESTLPNNGLLSITGGGSYQPTTDNTVNPRIAANYNDPSGLSINALVDEYRKTAGAGYGPVNANITQTDNDLIKQIGLQGQNFGASIVDSNAGKTYGLNALFNNVLGGDVSANAYKDNYGSGAGLEYEASTEDLYDYFKGLLN